MKKYVRYCLLFTILPLYISAQTSIDAEDVISKINTGESLRYENVTINGDLDFTSVADRERVSVNSSDGYEFRCQVRQNISFINCIFTGDVVGYRERFKRAEPAFAVFHGKTEFLKCELERRWAFRHGVFQKTVDFSGTVFSEDPTFRHVKFNRTADFSDSEFSERVDFRHTYFRADADFRNAVFKSRADFRHCTVLGKSNFRDADFQRRADFKHANIRDRYIGKFTSGKW